MPKATQTANAPQKPGGEAADARSSASSSVLVLVACAVVTSATLCGTLTVRYVNSRPLDMRQSAARWVKSVDDTLVDCQVPPENIRIGEARPVSDDRAKWLHYRIQVNTPGFHDIRGLESVIRSRLAQGAFSVVRTAAAPDQVDLHLSSGGREYAVVSLREIPAAAPPPDAANPLREEAVQLRARLFRQPGQPRADRGPKASSSRASAASVPILLLSRALAEPAYAMELTGLDPDELVRRLFPDLEDLPLDSDFLNGDASKQVTPSPQAETPGKLRVAIIVDDGGYGGSITEEILSMTNALTLSILPHARCSADTAKRGAELGFEIMLHMPMENVAGKLTYPGEVKIDMTGAEMLRLTDEALSDVPGAVGINNHTGSRFTSNAEAMRTYLCAIKDKGLFFIDSRTTSRATAYEIAQELRIPSAARDLFLDHESSQDYIRARFRQLIEIVKRQGSAIAICHFRKNTVPVLREMLPEFEKHGIEIVHASKLIR